MDLGYAVNTGSVGNSLGVTRCHALIIEGELDSSEISPIQFSFLSIPYDKELAIARAEECPDLPAKESYIKELLTGVYSR